LNDWILAASSAGLASLVAGLVTARRATKRLEATRAEHERLRELDRGTLRRRLESAESELAVAQQHARRLAGLDPLAASTLQGAALAGRVARRLGGLSLDSVVVADDAGLGWVGTTNAEGDALAASAGAFLTHLSAQATGLDVELADTRHVSLRRLPGSLPNLALGATAVSQLPAPHAVASAIELARLSSGAPLEPSARPEPRRAWRLGADSTSQVTATLCDELERARGERELLAILAGNDLLAASADTGMSTQDFTLLTQRVIAAVSFLERRMGSVARCGIAHLSDGRTLSVAPLGQGRFRVAALDDTGGVDGLFVDRLIGRVRRLLPAPAAGEVLLRRVA
jgi:hypothetical protein